MNAAYSFNSFSSDNLKASKEFYETILGLQVDETDMGILEISGIGNHKFIIYPKGKDHQPANFTVLNFEVQDIEQVVTHLISKGVVFEKYGKPLKTDDKGIFRGKDNHKIAWFKDPSGNILSIIEER